METTGFSSTPSTATVAGVFVAGLSLGAVYAFNHTRLSQLLGTGTHEDTHTHSTRTSADGARAGDEGEVQSAVNTTRKGRKKKKGKGVGVGEAGESESGGRDGGEGKAKGKGKGKADAEDEAAVVVPGGFEGVGAGGKVDAVTGMGVDVGPQEVSSAGTAFKQGDSENKTKTKTKKKKKAKAKAKAGESKDGDEDKEAGSRPDKEVAEVRRAAAHGPRSGDSTDASVFLSPSVSGDALASSRATGKGSLGVSTRLALSSELHAQARAHAPSQPRGIRLSPSLSLDTDSSWTHVDHRRLKTSRSTDGQARGLADAMDVTSSDLASTASDSPVVERMDNVIADMRGARVDLVERTLAEKLVPRPTKTGVDE